jgi:hypothetical protein
MSTRPRLTAAEKSAIRSAIRVGIAVRNGLRKSLNPYHASRWMRGYLDAVQILAKFLPDGRLDARYNASVRRLDRLSKPGRYVRRTRKIWVPK